MDAGAADAVVELEVGGEEVGGGRSFISDRSDFAKEDSLRLLLSSGNKLRVISYTVSSSDESSPSSPVVDDCNGTTNAIRPGCLRVVVIVTETKPGGER